jgi:hypothetical protein
VCPKEKQIAVGVSVRKRTDSSGIQAHIQFAVEAVTRVRRAAAPQPEIAFIEGASNGQHVLG